MPYETVTWEQSGAVGRLTLAAESAFFGLAFGRAQDFFEGTAAFVEKRAPAFTGR